MKSNEIFYVSIYESIKNLQSWTDCAPHADRAGKTSETRSNFRARTFCYVKKKEPVDLQVFNRTGQTI